MRKIVHLSDLHFGRVDQALLEPLAARVRAIAPDLVAVSGDLTQRARAGEFRCLFESATGRLSGHSLNWRAEPSVCVVLAASGYPGRVRAGDVISGIENVDCVFQAGTKLAGTELVTSGGRVVGVTARGANLQSAIDAAYSGVSKISFAGMQFRKDIGQKGLNRC